MLSDISEATVRHESLRTPMLFYAFVAGHPEVVDSSTPACLSVIAALNLCQVGKLVS